MQIQTKDIVGQAIANTYTGETYSMVKRGGTLIELDDYKARYKFDEPLDLDALKTEYDRLKAEVAEDQPEKNVVESFLEKAEANQDYIDAVAALDPYPLAKFSALAAMLESDPNTVNLRRFRKAIRTHLGNDVLKSVNGKK